MKHPEYVEGPEALENSTRFRPRFYNESQEVKEAGLCDELA